jgi:hypothetical protein
MDGRKLLVEEEVQQQASIATIVLLPAASALADGQGVTDQQAMTEFFEQTMEPQRVTGSFHAHHRGSCERSIKRTHVVPLMIQRDLVLLPIGGIHPTDGLGADMQIHSDVHCHLRLLSKPKPNDGGREYQLSPQRARVS